MEWIKGIKQVQQAKWLVEELEKEIATGRCDQNKIPDRIAEIQSVLETARISFKGEIKYDE